jgi:hypothetical protein
MKCPVVMRPTSRAGREVSKMLCSMLPGNRCENKQYLYGSAADYEQRFSMGFRKFNLEAFSIKPAENDSLLKQVYVARMTMSSG